MRSKLRDEAFRAAARRLYGTRDVTIPLHANVERAQDGSAFVDAQVAVPEHEAQAEADRIAEEARRDAEKKGAQE